MIDAPEPVLDEPLPDPDRLYLPRSGQKVVEDLAELEAQSATSASSRPVPSPAGQFRLQPASSVSNRASSVSNRASSVSSSAGSVTAASASSPAAADEAGDKPGSSASSPVLDAWVVQVASLRSAESAQQLRKRLQARGYKAYVRQAQTGQGEVSRVFIGPKLDKALAEAVKQEIDPVFKVDSLVLRFKP